jgi:hypothetical protein
VEQLGTPLLILIFAAWGYGAYHLCRALYLSRPLPVSLSKTEKWNPPPAAHRHFWKGFLSITVFLAALVALISLNTTG